MRVRRMLVAVAAAAGLALITISAMFSGGSASPAQAAGLPPLPAGWPSTLQLGMEDSPGGAAAMRATTSFGARYQYLAGGVNTGSGWATWNAGGAFATYYIQDSIANGIIPVFTYYQMRQSAPGNSQSSESAGDLANLRNTATMNAYYSDLKLFFQKAAAFPKKMVVLHVEPDLWGYIEQASTGDNASTVTASVSNAGLSELGNLPNTAAGFAQAIVKLRDLYAPNVSLAYSLSYWGTGVDPIYSKPSLSTIDTLAGRSAAFYRSLGANFNLSFAEFSDRDAGFYQYQYGNPNTWWGPTDYANNVRYLADFVAGTGKRVALWQIPYGNSIMMAENNTWDHYQDNHVQWLLGDATRTNLTAYANAGVIAFLFGRGADGATCACDADKDGIQNPAPINGNTMASLSADDDGGYFRWKAQAYYAAGAMPLAGGTSGSTPTATATPTNTPTPTPTPSTTVASWTSSASVSPQTVNPGGTAGVTTLVASPATTSALVDIEIHNASGTKVFQQYFANQSFSAAVARSFSASWTVPSSTATGTYTVEIGVFAPGWSSLYSWNGKAAQLQVAAPAPIQVTSWVSSASVSPGSVSRGSTASVTASVTSPTTTSALVDIEIYSPSGQKVFQHYVDNQSFTADITRAFSASWAVPSTAATGTYTVDIGIFSPGWGTVYAWNGGADTFSVQ